MPDMGVSVRYLALGHPAWPGNLDFATYAEAADWFNEHRETHPVYIDKVRTERVRLASPGPAISTHEYGYDVNSPETHAAIAERTSSDSSTGADRA